MRRVAAYNLYTLWRTAYPGLLWTGIRHPGTAFSLRLPPALTIQARAGWNLGLVQDQVTANDIPEGVETEGGRTGGSFYLIGSVIASSSVFACA